jgi:hypothetical protein
MPHGDRREIFGFVTAADRRIGSYSSGLLLKNIKRGALRGKNRWLLGFVVTFIIAVIKDLSNPKGLLRQLILLLRYKKIE